MNRLVPLDGAGFFMPEILLATANARYSHASFGLRYLLANLGDLADKAAIAEFEISRSPHEIAEAIVAQGPRILGLGVYIWNVRVLTEVVALLKRVRPGLTIVLGGPEVSHEAEDQEIVRLADFTIQGEADLEFPQLCSDLLEGRRPLMKVLQAKPPHFHELKLPYSLYDSEDIAHRVVYVEASRGCPFTCEFCLSSLEIPVRAAPLEAFLAEMEDLLKRGTRQFKFVDRTFNLNTRVGSTILQFFLDRMQPDLFLHFEMIPDRLPEELKSLIRQFPAGSLQFEVGIQSFNPDVQALISRRQDQAKTVDNLRWLRQNTSVHIHADLIAGLPGETLESFGQGFDTLRGLGPQEIQVGILKRLRGTPIIRHDAAWEMVYSPQAPYEILSTKLIPYPDMCRLKRFARYWDLLGNSGRLARSLPLLLGSGSAFHQFMHLSDWLWRATGQTHAIALARSFELVFHHAKERMENPADLRRFALALCDDYRQDGRTDVPTYLAEFDIPPLPRPEGHRRQGTIRQARHQTG